MYKAITAKECIDLAYWEHTHYLQGLINSERQIELYWDDFEHIIKVDLGTREEYFPDYLYDRPDCLSIGGVRCPRDAWEDYYWDTKKNKWVWWTGDDRDDPHSPDYDPCEDEDDDDEEDED